MAIDGGREEAIVESYTLAVEAPARFKLQTSTLRAKSGSESGERGGIKRQGAPLARSQSHQIAPKQVSPANPPTLT